MLIIICILLNRSKLAHLKETFLSTWWLQLPQLLRKRTPPFWSRWHSSFLQNLSLSHWSLLLQFISGEFFIFLNFFFSDRCDCSGHVEIMLSFMVSLLWFFFFCSMLQTLLNNIWTSWFSYVNGIMFPRVFLHLFMSPKKCSNVWINDSKLFPHRLLYAGTHISHSCLVPRGFCTWSKN